MAEFSLVHLASLQNIQGLTAGRATETLTGHVDALKRIRTRNADGAAALRNLSKITTHRYVCGIAAWACWNHEWILAGNWSFTTDHRSESS